MKKTLFYLLFFLGMGQLMSSCHAPLYSLANLQTNARMLLKPCVEDSAPSQFYVQGRFAITDFAIQEENGVRNNEPSKIYEIGLHRSHNFKTWVLSYGGNLYGGNYQVRKVWQYEGRKKFTGGSVVAEIAPNIVKDRMEIRPIGIRLSALYEKGNYYDFKDEATLDGLIRNAFANGLAWGLSTPSEFVFKQPNQTLITYTICPSLFWGNDGTKSWLLSSSFAYTRKRTSITSQLALNTTLENKVAGLSGAKLDIYASLGLAYRIPPIKI